MSTLAAFGVRVLHYATHIPSPSVFSFFIPQVRTCTLALAYLLSVAGWSSLFVVTFSVEDTVLCNVRKVASFRFTLLWASTCFPKAKNLRKARTIEPCLFMGWKPVSKSKCVRQRENCQGLVSNVNDRENSVLLQSQITGHSVCHPPGQGTGRQQSETDLGSSIFPTFHWFCHSIFH